jgi:signal transduction histidine kinase
MKQLVNKLRNFGVQAGQTPNQQRSIILLNEITMFLLVLQLFVYPEIIYNLDYRGMVVMIIVQTFTVGPLILSYFKQTIAAKWYFNVVFTIFMTLLIITHGWELRADYCYLVFTVTAIIFFNNKLHRFLLILLIVCCYLIAVYYTDNYTAIFAGNVSGWNSIIVFSSMIVCITLVISRFVSENKSYQDELNKTLDTLQQEQVKIEVQNDSLEKVNKDLERFAYISSHNLKTPVRTIRSFSDLIGRDLKKGKHDNLEEYLDFIKQGAAQMQLLITDILEYSKFNQQQNFETTAVDLNNTIDFIHSQLQSFTDKKIHLQTSQLPVIQSNRTFINAIFQNLIENGVKYNESEHIKIKISYQDKGDKHLFAFYDNGIGIEVEYHDKIFKMFERLQNDAKYTGSGVGLGMSKKIIEKLNGEIWVISELGKGSTFYVELPKVYSNILVAV